MNVLINKTSSLGDIIHCYPIIAYLKERFPDVTIDWIAEKHCRELVSRHKEIQFVHVVNTKKWRKRPFSKETRTEFLNFKKILQSKTYDVLFDLQGNLKSGIFTFLAKAKKKVGFGWKTVAEIPNLLFTHNRYNPNAKQNIRLFYLSIVQTYFKDFSIPKNEAVELQMTLEERLQIEQILNPNSRQIAVCPGANWKNKKLPTKTLQNLLKQFPHDCYFLFVWGNEFEKKTADALSYEFPDRSRIVPRLSFPCLQNLFARVDLVLSMDSLPLHLAGTTKTRTLSFFGPSSAEIYKPLGPQHVHYQGTCPYGITFEKRCPKLRSCLTGACLRTIESDQVSESVSFASQE